jgi:hypothetical protein
MNETLPVNATNDLWDRDRLPVVLETLAVGLSTGLIVSLLLVIGYVFSE